MVEVVIGVVKQAVGEMEEVSPWADREELPSAGGPGIAASLDVSSW